MSLLEKQNVILDLDLTLIYVTTSLEETKESMNEFFKANEIDEYNHYVFVRPHVISFLINVNKNYNVYIYTRSKKKYALECCKLLKSIDGTPLINEDHVFSRTDQSKITNFEYKSLLFIRQFLPNSNISIDNSIIFDDRFMVWSPEERKKVILVPPYVPCHYPYPDNWFNFCFYDSFKNLPNKQNSLFANCKFFFVRPTEIIFPFTEQYSSWWDIIHFYGGKIAETMENATHIVRFSDVECLTFKISNNNPFPYIVHWSWILQSIHFCEKAPEKWFFHSKLETIFQPFNENDYLHSNFNSRTKNFTFWIH